MVEATSWGVHFLAFPACPRQWGHASHSLGHKSISRIDTLIAGSHRSILDGSWVWALQAGQSIMGREEACEGSDATLRKKASHICMLLRPVLKAHFAVFYILKCPETRRKSNLSCPFLYPCSLSHFPVGVLEYNVIRRKREVERTYTK